MHSCVYCVCVPFVILYCSNSARHTGVTTDKVLSEGGESRNDKVLDLVADMLQYVVLCMDVCQSASIH